MTMEVSRREGWGPSSQRAKHMSGPGAREAEGRNAGGAGGEPADQVQHVATCSGLQQHLLPYTDVGANNVAAASLPPVTSPAKCLL